MAAQGSGLIVNVTYAFPGDKAGAYVGHQLYDLAKASLTRWAGFDWRCDSLGQTSNPWAIPLSRVFWQAGGKVTGGCCEVRITAHEVNTSSSSEPAGRLAFGLAEELRPYGAAAVALSPGHMRTERVLAHFGTGGLPLGGRITSRQAQPTPCLPAWQGSLLPGHPSPAREVLHLLLLTVLLPTPPSTPHAPCRRAALAAGAWA